MGGVMLILVFVVMPGFSFASGHLSSSELNRRQLVNLMRMWVVFFIQQGMFAALMAVAKTGQSIQFMPFSFWGLTGVTWFLFCLVVWRTLLPLLALLRWPVMSTLLLSLVAQLTDQGGNVYAQTLFCFLPFFMAGYQCKPESLERWRRPAVQVVFCSVLVLSGVASTILPRLPGVTDVFKSIEGPVFNAYGCLYGGDVAGELHSGGRLYECASWFGPVGSLAFFLSAIPLIYGFLACVPRQKIWGLTRAGMMSIYIYLFHIYFLIAASIILAQILHVKPGAAEHGVGLVHGPIGIMGCIVLAISIWAFLACGWARFVCCWCVEPRVERCLVQDEKTETSTQPEV